MNKRRSRPNSGSVLKGGNRLLSRGKVLEQYTHMAIIFILMMGTRQSPNITPQNPFSTEFSYVSSFHEVVVKDHANDQSKFLTIMGSAALVRGWQC